jgi:HPt (histidine-containing phosphotransfer) domain-containing protein
MNGVSEEVAALVPGYLASKMKQIEDARANVAAQEFEPVRRFAHNLKGTGIGYGFPRIEEIGAEMEEAALDCDAPGISRKLAELLEFLSEEAGKIR